MRLPCCSFCEKKKKITIGALFIPVGRRYIKQTLRTIILTWNPHMETCRHTKNFNSELKIRS